jgi:peroxiredoxin
MADQYESPDLSHVGPAIGQRMPDVVLPNQHGELVDLHRRRGEGEALFVVYRSADW